MRAGFSNKIPSYVHIFNIYKVIERRERGIYATYGLWIFL